MRSIVEDELVSHQIRPVESQAGARGITLTGPLHAVSPLNQTDFRHDSCERILTELIGDAENARHEIARKQCKTWKKQSP